MKIAFLNIYNGLVDRGAETYVTELANRLSLKHKVTVFQAGEEKGNEKYKIEKINVGINWNKKVEMSTLKRKFFVDYWSFKILFFTFKCVSKIWKEKYDVVIPVNGGWMPAVLRIVTWLYGGKMIISGQSGIGWDDINNLWCFPNVFVALSSYAAHWAKGMNNFIKVKVIPNGVDTKKFNSNGEKYNVDLPKPVVFCAGALIKQKRIDLAIKAVAKLKNVSLLVSGKGDLKNETIKLGEKLLGKRFKLISASFDEISSVYRSVDLFTLPSEDYQAFEIVLVEAMASGLGVVANNDPIREEIVGDAGLLVDPTNLSNYSSAIKKALGTKWGNKPRKQSEKYNWDNISKRYEDLLNSLLT